MKSIVFVVLILVNVAIAQTSGGSQDEPLGMFASVEFTDLRTRDEGNGLFSRQAWLGTYWKPSEMITALFGVSYGQNDLASGDGDVEAFTGTAAVTLDIVTIRKSIGLKCFVLGEVGAASTQIADASPITTFLSAAGVGLKMKASVGVVAFHLRAIDAKEFQKWAIGVDYAVPFDLYNDK